MSASCTRRARWRVVPERRAVVWDGVIPGALLAFAFSCGPAVEAPTDAEGSGDQGSGLVTATTEVASAGSATTLGPASVSDSDSATAATIGGSSTGGPPLAECIRSAEQRGSWRAVGPEPPYELDTTCLVLDILSGGDVDYSLELDCATGPDRLACSGKDPADYFTAGDSLRLVAERGEDDSSYIAVFDDDGDQVMAGGSLPESAVDFGDLFGGLTVEPVDTDCRSKIDPIYPRCYQHRVAVDFTLDGSTIRLFDGNMGELGGWEVFTGALWGEPDESEPCPTGPSGTFAIFRP